MNTTQQKKSEDDTKEADSGGGRAHSTAGADGDRDGQSGRSQRGSGSAGTTRGRQRDSGNRDSADDSADDSVDHSVDDSVDFFGGYDSEDAIQALKTAGAVLTGLTVTAGLTTLVVMGIRKIHERNSENETNRQRSAMYRGVAVSRSRGRRQASRGQRARGGTQRGGQTDLNRATLSDLKRLPGVGHTTAKLIVRHRPYDNVEDVKEVTGIRSSTFRELRPHAKV